MHLCLRQTVAVTVCLDCSLQLLLELLQLLSLDHQVAVVLQLLTVTADSGLESVQRDIVELGHHLSSGVGVIRQEAQRASLVQDLEPVGVLGAHGARLDQDFRTDRHGVSSFHGEGA